MTKNFEIMEVGLRDGLQIIKKDISIDYKLSIIESLIESGIRNIQVTSFVNPKRVPSMADAEELVKLLPIVKGVQFSGLVFNQIGVERAIRAGLTKIETSISISETYSYNNLGMSIPESIDNLKKIVSTADKNKMQLRAGLQCVWGSTYDDTIDQMNVIKRLSDILEMGISRISLCDTTGMARPNDVYSVLDIIYKTFPNIKISMHLHNTNGLGLLNLNEALKFDINEIDTSMGGIGGSPFIEGSSGNIATEDTIYMLDNLGYNIGIDIKKISKISRKLEEKIGGSYFSGNLYKMI
jgi:hydroxymethylglutaryl-CoA lyase|tara:strand:+ start:4650 stop:5537 length:888 start_codon:yes stop_codon:yes gene_type:complete